MGPGGTVSRGSAPKIQKVRGDSGFLPGPCGKPLYTRVMQRPESTEYAASYSTYTGLVPDGDVLLTMAAAPDALEALLGPVTPQQETFAYGPGKWSIRELVGHVIDAERLFSFRALHFARGDQAALPGMEQDEWAGVSHAAQRDLVDLLAEFRELRGANVRLFASLDDTALRRRGVASGSEVTVCALIHILCGHELHHRGVLAERYLPGIGLS
jgi:uncharacterized damage-inducible protein DinB